MTANTLLWLRAPTVLLLMHAALVAHAQPSDEEPGTQWWFNVSAGPGDVDGGESGTLNLSSVNVGFGRSQLELRNFVYDSGTVSDLFECLFVFDCPDNQLTIDEWGLLYGRRFLDGDLILSFGIGRTDYSNTVAFSEDRYGETTIPIELSWSFRRRRIHGFDLTLAVSHGREDTAFGLVFGINVGQLRGW